MEEAELGWSSWLCIACVVMFALAGAANIIATHISERRQWAELADALGLAFRPGLLRRGDVMEGELDGVRFVFDIDLIRTDEGTKPRTRVRAFHHTPLDLGLKLRPAGMLSSLGAAIGLVRVIDTGDATFDGAYTVKGRDRERVVAALALDVRQRIRDYEAEVGPIDLDDTCVTHFIDARIATPQDVERVVTHQRGLVLALRRALDGVG